MLPTAVYANPFFFNSLWLLMDLRSKDRDDLYNPCQPGWGIYFHLPNAGGGGAGLGGRTGEATAPKDFSEHADPEWYKGQFPWNPLKFGLALTCITAYVWTEGWDGRSPLLEDSLSSPAAIKLFFFFWHSLENAKISLICGLFKSVVTSPRLPARPIIPVTDPPRVTRHPLRHFVLHFNYS